MLKQVKAFLLSFTIVVTLLYTAAGTIPVRADGETGTDATATEAAVPTGDPTQPSGDPTAVSNPSGDGSQPTEAAPVDVAPAPSSDSGAPPATPPEPLLEQVPDNTTVTVLDASGQTVPLVTQAAAEAIASDYDPIWCPAGQTPTPGANGCTSSYGSFDELLSFLEANQADVAYQQAGTIYIQQGSYAGGESSIDFNDYNLSSSQNYNLTLQGGWDTVDNSVDPADTTSFNVPITIGSSSNPWIGSLTLNNLTIGGVTGGTGLTLYTQNDIVLSNVEVTNSQVGADLNAGDDVVISNSDFNDNSEGGATIKAGRNVSVTNTNFNRNGSANTGNFGLNLQSGADVSLSQLSASDNQAYGANITADGQVGVDDSFFSGNVSYAEDSYGLTVVSLSGVYLNTITADNNYNFGAYLEGTFVQALNSTFNHNGSGSAADPVGSGLEIQSSGGATLDTVEASFNELFGANIQAAGNVFVSNGLFNSNQGYAYVQGTGWVFDGYGLQVNTTGAIELDTVSANDNTLYGASLTGTSVKVSNSSFSDNSSDWTENPTAYGLQVTGSGAVTLASVTANNNQMFGANLQAGGPVTLSDSFFNGNQSYYYDNNEKVYQGYGLRVVTSQEISAVNVTAENNYLYGAHIEAKDVAVDGGHFSNNGSGDGLALTGRGLEVISQFEVALADITANNNQLFGADVVAGDLVAIENSSFNGHIAYVYDYFTHAILSRDGGYGLRVVTNGNIALEDVTADNNYLYGAYLQGDNTAVEGVLGVSSFSGNGSGVLSQPPGSGFGYGLKIVSTGSVTLFNINSADSVGNQLFGADITAADDVSVINAFFSGNRSVTFDPCVSQDLNFYGYGLQVVTPGDIQLDGVVANFNNLWGANLFGNNVMVANSQFNNNISDSNIFIDDTGLLVHAQGFVDLYKVEARENRLIGADITAGGPVFITDSNFTDNRGFTCLYDWCPEGSITYHGYGLKVTTPDLIDMVGTNASGNNLFGAELNGSQVNVTNSTFNDNVFGNGLTVNATDNVNLTNVTAIHNGGNGTEVTGICGRLAQVIGGTFSDNDRYGLSVTNATLNLDGTQVFSNNGSGNIFTDTSTCAALVALITTQAPLQAPGVATVSTSTGTGSTTTSLKSTGQRSTTWQAAPRRSLKVGYSKTVGKFTTYLFAHGRGRPMAR